MAAAGIVALDSMIDRLADDHVSARRLAELLLRDRLALVDLSTVQTNMIRADFSPLSGNGIELREYLARRGILMSLTDKAFSRLVTHYWISDADVDKVVGTLNAFKKK